MTPIFDGGRHIDGLGWTNLWHIPNGSDSKVIPIPSLRPTNIVFKGDNDFSYGHYGVHLGQIDRLIFIGPQDNTVEAYFIDCRAESPTFRVRLRTVFKPCSTKLLSIPPGIAHTFDTRAVATLNLYSILLPDPSDWLSGQSQWTVKGDIVNVAMNVLDEDIPSLLANKLPASETFYKLIASEQRSSLADLEHEYPFTQDIDFKDGGHERLKFWKRLESGRRAKEWTPIDDIDGAGWRGNLVVWTGDTSGYVPLLDRRPKHVIDHGESIYSHDAYGIHLGGDDHLVFIGPSTCTATCELVDLRRNSPTLHQTVRFRFSPDPLHTLVIPRGVAHRFENLEGIFTINQPLTYLPIDMDYEPGNDVIDWPINRRPFPVLDVNQSSASEEFYEILSSRQKEMLSTPPKHATPSVILTSDSDGNPVRVAIREKI